MLPYFPQPAIRVGGFRVTAFGVCAVTSIGVSIWIVVRRARRFGVSAEEMFWLWFWMYVGALSSLGLFDSSGISSTRAIAGGLGAGLLVCWSAGLSWSDTLRRMDAIAYAVPHAWIFGRLGCALAHDHRGIASTSWIAVDFPGGARYDLGLIEFLFLGGVVIVFRLLDRHPRPDGFFLALYGMVYGGFRIWLEYLRFQPAQFGYAGAAGVLIGMISWTLVVTNQQRSRPAITR